MRYHYANIWQSVADAVPDRTALVHGRRRYTWSAYEDAAARLASAFQSEGVGPGDGVGIVLTNCPEFSISVFAAFKLGAVPVNINYRYGPDEIRYLLRDSGSRVVVCHDAFLDATRQALDGLDRPPTLIEVSGAAGGTDQMTELLAAHEPRAREERPGTDIHVLYTGGTTGMPKAVAFEHDAFIRARLAQQIGDPHLARPAFEDVQQFVDAARDGNPMVSVPVSPLIHGTALRTALLQTQLLGGTTVTLESARLDADELWRVVEAERVTHLVFVGDAFARPMVDALRGAEARGAPYDTSSLVAMISGGVKWSADTKRELRTRTNAVLHDSIGSTEAGAIARQLHGPGDSDFTERWDLVPGARVLDDLCEDVAAGSPVPGMLAVPSLALGYLRDEARTAEMFVELDGTRYCLTGDKALVEPDGRITFVGRGSSAINTAGEKVFPAEVEDVLMTHPHVTDCVVLGEDHEVFGSQVVALVALVSDSPATDDELRGWVRDRLAGYKTPKRLVRVEVVLRQSTGKADMDWARRQLEQQVRG